VEFCHPTCYSTISNCHSLPSMEKWHFSFWAPYQQLIYKILEVHHSKNNQTTPMGECMLGPKNMGVDKKGMKFS
jgi:hypothetical protein